MLESSKQDNNLFKKKIKKNTKKLYENVNFSKQFSSSN